MLSGCRPSTSFSGATAALDLQLAQVVGERELHDDPVDLRVAVQPADRGQELVLGHVDRQVDLLGTDADVGARLVLLPHVDPRGLVVAHEHGRQARA